MHFTLSGDSSGRAVGTISHNGVQATVTGWDHASAVEDLRLAVESAISHEYGECFWHEAFGEYRWLFRRAGARMRVVILQSSGTLTGWEDCFWAECDADEFRNGMRPALEAFDAPKLKG